MNKGANTDDYNHLIAPNEFRMTVKGSRFMGWCVPIDDEEQAMKILAQRSNEHHKATHHCWALRVGTPDNLTERYSDAGEPNGTAGRPILDQLRHFNLIKTLLVVSRWFGGTKLGKGGLVRAYSHCSANTLNTAKIEPLIYYEIIKVQVTFDNIGLTEYLCAKHNAKITQTEFAETVLITLQVPINCAEELQKDLLEKSANRIRVIS